MVILLITSSILFQLLYSSALFGYFLYFSLFVKLLTMFFHSSPEFLEHIYDLLP